MIFAEHGGSHSTFAAWVVIGLLVGVGVLCFLLLRFYRKQKDVRSDLVGEGSRMFRGEIAEQSDARRGVSRGSGFIRVGSKGLQVRRTQSWSGGKGASWSQIGTFARNGGRVQIEWKLTTGDGYHGIQAEMTRVKAEDLEAIMKRHLDESLWKHDVNLGREGMWDSHWSGR